MHAHMVLDKFDLRCFVVSVVRCLPSAELPPIYSILIIAATRSCSSRSTMPPPPATIAVAGTHGGITRDSPSSPLQWSHHLYRSLCSGGAKQMHGRSSNKRYQASHGRTEANPSTMHASDDAMVMSCICGK
jgi:hypothetical protein